MTSIIKPDWFSKWVISEAGNFRLREGAPASVKREFKLLFQDVNGKERFLLPEDLQLRE